MLPSEIEQHLVDTIHAGELPDEDTLIRFLRPAVFISLRRSLGGNSEDIEDLCNDILIAILEKIRGGHYDPQKGRLKQYASGITRNKIIGHYKKNDKKPSTPGNLPEQSVAANFDNDLEAAERRELIERNLKKLPEKYKEVLRQRYYEERSIAEIAEKIELPKRRVSERINYAQKLLRKRLARKKILSIFVGLMLIPE